MPQQTQPIDSYDTNITFRGVLTKKEVQSVREFLAKITANTIGNANMGISVMPTAIRY